MGVKEKRGASPIGPVLLKIGVVLVFSIGGIVYNLFSSKREIKKPRKPIPPRPCPGNYSQGDCNDQTLQDLSPSVRDSRPNVRSEGGRDGSLLRELDEFLKEHTMSVESGNLSPTENLQPSVHEMGPSSCDEDEECDREIRILRSKVKFLEEREMILENKLLEYYGLKEQETAVVELQNRLRLQNMETKLYKVKVDLLQSENRKLAVQVADYAKVVAELEAAKAKIEVLRKKLTSEAERNREQILKLQERVTKLQDHEKKDVETDRDQGVEMQLQRRKELEEELEEFKKINHSLKLENSELAEKLDCLQMITTSTLGDEEVEAMKAERQRLRQENDDLRKEIEQLQDVRCTDLEELVYLRWINACLRYELRNYQPGPGETAARDLSRTLSPESEEKAKQLILEYANKEGYGDKDMNIIDFDPDQWSTSQFTDSGEPDESSADKMNHSSRRRVFAKLMKLLQGQDIKHCAQTPASPLDVALSVDGDAVSRSNSHSGSERFAKTTRTSPEGSARPSLEFLMRSHSQGHKLTNGKSSICSQRTNSDGSFRIFRRIDAMTGYHDNSSPGFQPHQDAEDAARTELVKYAEALQNSRGKSMHRRASSLSFF